MAFSKITPYIGGKSESDIQLAIDLFKASGCRTFVDRFAGSYRISFAVLQETNAWVDAHEIDQQASAFAQLLVNGTRSERCEVASRVDMHNHALYLDSACDSDMLAGTWAKLQELASEGTSLEAIAAFIAYMQNCGSSNPRRNLKGKRNAGYATSKIRNAKNRMCQLSDYSHHAKRILFNPSTGSRQPRFVYADVPYYRPGRTPCYAGHKPGCLVQAREYLQIAIDSAGPDGIVMYCNYYHVDICHMMRSIGAGEGVICGSLNTATNQQKNGEDLEHGYWLFKVRDLKECHDLLY